jgi:biopolymer transport protein ExbD
MREPTLIGTSSAPPETESALSRPARRRERMEFALPTINVIFLLMLYFLIAGTLVQRDEMSVLPPETAEVATDRLPRPLLLISNDGAFILDGKAIPEAELVAAAATAVADPRITSHQLNILAPAEMAAGPFLDILSEFGAAEVPVRIVTVEQDEASE